MKQSLRFQHDKNMVYRLKKALYGLTQAPHAWNEKIDAFFQDVGIMLNSISRALYS